MAKVGFCRAGYGPEDLRLLFPGHAAPGVADREPVRRPPRLGVREQLDLELDEAGGPRVLANIKTSTPRIVVSANLSVMHARVESEVESNKANGCSCQSDFNG